MKTGNHIKKAVLLSAVFLFLLGCGNRRIIKTHVSSIIITDSINEYTVKDGQTINWIVKNINGSRAVGQTACPFGYLRLIFVSGASVYEIFYAADSCSVFMYDGRCYIPESGEFNTGLRKLMRENGIDDHYFQD
jgi:hypothetical protein